MRRLLLLLGLCGLGLLASPVVQAASGTVSHAYSVSGQITDGSLVSLTTKQGQTIEPANSSNGDRLVGVTLPNNDSLIAIDASSRTVQVATNGSVTTLASTLNGSIHVGDQVSVSPFNGIGMKALPGSRVIGLAQTALDAHTATSSRTVTDKQGKTTKIQVGYLRLTIAIGTAPAADSQLDGLQKLAKSLTGRIVATWRVALSLTVFLVAIAALGVLIYASIYGSITAIGRNPLAKYAIFRTLGVVLGLAGITTGVAGFTIYLLLR